jgi:beta-glucosidase
VTVAGQVFTAVAAGATPTSVQFALGATDAATAANLAAAVNAHAAVKAAVSASSSGAVVTLAARTVGVAGNYLALATNSTSTVTLSGAALTGGAGTGKTVLTVSGKQYRDANGDGQLQPYEDWTLLELCRARDLVSRMTLAQKLGLMSEGGGLGNGTADGTLPASVVDAMVTSNVRQGLFRYATTAQQSATYVNHLNELAESLPLGIPVVVTGDPAHYTGVSMSAAGALTVNTPTYFTPWPGTLAFSAINDPALTLAHGDLVRQEFMASGLRWQLGPQIDPATEPRWSRVSGTLGSNPQTARKHAIQLVSGFQGSLDGTLRNGIAATMKHFVGYGAELGGMDGHSYYGRYTVFPGNNFQAHLLPFAGAVSVGVAAVMPSYTIAKEQYDIDPLQLPTAFSYELTTKVLKQQLGFKGLVTNDWGTMGTMGASIGGYGYGMEGLSFAERAALHLHAGSHQLGNESASSYQAAYDQKLIGDAEVNGAAEKILEMTFKLGLFENPFVDPSVASTIVRSGASRQAGFEAMKKAIVLLQNGDHLGTAAHYLPITPVASRDTNGDGKVSVYYDGVVDSIVGDATRPDGVSDLLGTYDYSAAAAGTSLAIENQPDLTKADIAVLRIAARAGSQTAGIPLSFDGTLTAEQLHFATDGSLAAAAASKKKIVDALRVRDGYRKSDGTVVAAANPTLKIVLVCNFSRPPILRPFVSGLVSLDEPSGQPGGYPSVSDEASIRQPGVTYPTGGGVDAVLVEFGAYDRAVLDFTFNRNVPAGFAFGSARLPLEIPSTDAEVAAQYEDLPDDTYAPTFQVGTGLLLPAS